MKTNFNIVKRMGLPDELSLKVLNILREVDQEFIPPLSYRDSSSTMSLKGEDVVEHGLNDYLLSLSQQTNYLVFDGAVLAGFLSIREAYSINKIPKWSPCRYLTTIAVSKKYRRKGLARKMYEFILEETRDRSGSLVTRTWGSNDSHISLALSLGLKKIKILSDHRGPSIDTVYMGIAYKE